MLAKLLSFITNASPAKEYRNIELFDINSFKENKIPSENNKYSIFFNIKSENQTNIIDFVNQLSNANLGLCSHIYIFRKKEINFLKFTNIKTSITEVDSSRRTIDNYFYFPPLIQSDHIIFIDDTFPLTTQNFFNKLEKIMYNIIDRPGVSKIYGPFASSISKSKESSDIQNGYNMIHTNFAIINYQYMNLYNILVKLLPKQLKEDLGIECADVLLNFFAYRLNKSPLTRIKMEENTQNVMTRFLINSTAQNKCVKLINEYKPDFSWESYSFSEEIPLI
ncbi:hypothetical protein TVAG_460050 [Trichomonas vaginalis G3]|uniref:Glycosyl transferase 64 domain-containing protein n=1 Tax=Trichomonas vaginalis (strain ATCC PRA-98 / G3) TaxID=412133 RepID=A2GA52_TRIV3|nr:spore coat polysaccharide biosynthesis protein SpsA, Chain A domain-containing protein [Trichomonas vaginalis G3]EAX85969.1 hypothetical protein TVAG_460050 [Trichomonas vaginalis G3]KAI5550993.1 spore coat polysaccharide biosynthesis protein SpsA, Chain A domain-containing protein [Trichomonas vaginalis G3]|eukprot:XP_001298899.1 hypothetical protein [Trichomonas vaginalis G3]